MATYDNGPIPNAGQFGIWQAQANQAYSSAQAKIAQQRGQFLQNAGVDSSGQLLGDDPNGGFQQLNAAQAQQSMADEAAQSASGLGGGVAAHHRLAAAQGYSKNAADFAKQITDTSGQYDQAASQNTTDYQNSQVNTLLASIQQAISQGNYNPADYSGINIPGYGDITSLLPPAPPSPGLGQGSTDTQTWTPPHNPRGGRRGGRRR
jgi:hypothetical protein